MRLVLYTGKGGVGKTTTAAAAAVYAAESGLRTLVASSDAAHSLGDVLGQRLGPEPRELSQHLHAIEIDPRVESVRHWGRIQEFLVSSFIYQGIEAVVAEELAMLPGAEELTTLLAVEHLADQGDYDLLVLDCAPTDSALRLVTLPDVVRGMAHVAVSILGALSGAAVPLAQRLVSVPLPDAKVFEEVERLLYRSLTALHARLTSPETSVRLVVTPERMPIDEARRAYTEFALFEVPCDAVVINRLIPDAAAQEPFFRDWARLQRERIEEVESIFAPLPVLRASLADDEVTGLERLAKHGEALFGFAAPDAVLCTAPRVRFERDGASYRAEIPLPGADPSQLDVVKIADDLVVSTPARRRSLKLPRKIAPLSLEDARLAGGTLRVRFVRPDRETESSDGSAGGEAAG